MFQCKDCAKSDYKEWIISFGKCEVCWKVGECSDC